MRELGSQRGQDCLLTSSLSFHERTSVAALVCLLLAAASCWPIDSTAPLLPAHFAPPDRKNSRRALLQLARSGSPASDSTRILLLCLWRWNPSSLAVRLPVSTERCEVAGRSRLLLSSPPLTLACLAATARRAFGLLQTHSGLPRFLPPRQLTPLPHPSLPNSRTLDVPPVHAAQ